MSHMIWLITGFKWTIYKRFIVIPIKIHLYVAKTDEMNVMLAVILLISKIARLIEIEDFKYWFCHNLVEI